MPIKFMRRPRERHPRENFSKRFSNWNSAQAAAERERQRLAYLERGPLPANPAHLLEMVNVRVLKPFGLGGGQRAEPGKVVQVERHVGLDMVSLGKAEFIE